MMLKDALRMISSVPADCNRGETRTRLRERLYKTVAMVAGGPQRTAVEWSRRRSSSLEYVDFYRGWVVYLRSTVYNTYCNKVLLYPELDSKESYFIAGTIPNRYPLKTEYYLSKDAEEIGRQSLPLKITESNVAIVSLGSRGHSANSYHWLTAAQRNKTETTSRSDLAQLCYQLEDRPSFAVYCISSYLLGYLK